MKKRGVQILGIGVVLSMLVASLAACGPTPTPEVAAEDTAVPEPVISSQPS